jgi:predicted DNA-binding transcriptional regulator YafY
LEISNIKIILPIGFNVEGHFKFCFGIMSADNNLPKEIILSFEPHQGKYVKTLPLHESQQILVDNEAELQIKLTLYITYDFIMELLSFGSNVIVLKPESLANAIKEKYQQAILNY